MKTLRRFTPDLLIALLLFVVPLIFFFPQTLGGRTLVPAENLYQWEPYRAMAAEVGAPPPHNALYSDLILENYAWRQFVAEQAAQGQLPLWQPNILAGTPFLAAGQSLTLYPFSFIYLILPLWMAYGWFTVVQLWIAGLCMAVLIRTLGLSRGGALIAGLTYQLSGFFMASVVFPMILAAAAWLPLELAMIHLITRRDKNPIPSVIIGAIGLAMVALAGHVEALYFTLLVMGFYALWRLVDLTRLSAGKISNFKFQISNVVWLATMVALGLALGAVQIIPAYELASRSFREGGATLEQIRGWAYPIRQLLAFLMPNFYGNPAHHQIFDLFTGQWNPVVANSQGGAISTTEWGIKNYVEGAAYVGILPLALALIATLQYALSRIPRLAVKREGESPLAFIVLGLLSLTFAFGLPTYDLLYYGLPFFNQSHSPFRWVWPLTLCIAVLAAFGIDYLTPNESGGVGARYISPLRKPTLWLGRIVIGVGAVILLALAILRVFHDSFASVIERVFSGFALAPNAFPDARAFFSYEAVNIALMGLMLILAGVVILAARRAGARYISPLRIPIWQGVAALVVIADLFIASWGLHPASDPKLLEVVPPSIQWLKDRQAENPLQPFRVMAYQTPGSTKTLNANMLWLHGLEDASGYDSLIPAQYVEYMKVIMPQGDLPYNRVSPLYEAHADALNSPLLDLLGVRYAISESEISNPRWQQVYQDPAVRIYENSEVVPRAFSLTAYYGPVGYSDSPSDSNYPSFSDAVAQHDVRHYFLVPDTDKTLMDSLSDMWPGEMYPATITSRKPGEVWIDVAIDVAGNGSIPNNYVVLTESYFPGWRAWVRPIGAPDSAEKEVPVHLVDGNFQMVFLLPGRWTVRMKYSPDSVKFGGLISLLSGLVIVFLLGVWAWPRLYREEGEGHAARRVAKNALTPIVLNLFNKGILFVLTFFSLRILGPEGAGKYTYAVVIWGWFEIFANFGLNTYLTREVARQREPSEAGRHLANTTLLRLALAVIGIPLMIGFIALRQTFIAPALDSATLWTLGLLYAGLFFSTISTGLTALFYAFEKAEYPAAIQTVSAFLTTGLGVAALLLGFGIVGLATVSVIVNAVTLIILASLSKRLFNVTPLSVRQTPAEGEAAVSISNFKFQISNALSASFPLMLNHLLATLFFRIDVTLLEALKGPIVVGWYRIVYTWVDTVGLIPSLFTLALFPRLSKQASDDRPALKRAYILALKLMTMISVPMAIFTTLLAPVLVNILAGQEYLPHGAIALQIFIWAMTIGWLNSVTQYVIIALNRQRTLTIAFVIAAGFNITANLIFIPQYSYIAASVITILSEFALWGIFYVVILSELGRINWLATLGRVWAAGLVCAAATFTLGTVNVWLGLAAGVFVYGAALLLFRPLDAAETATIGGLLPESVRSRYFSTPV